MRAMIETKKYIPEHASMVLYCFVLSQSTIYLLFQPRITRDATWLHSQLIIALSMTWLHSQIYRVDWCEAMVSIPISLKIHISKDQNAPEAPPLVKRCDLNKIQREIKEYEQFLHFHKSIDFEDFFFKILGWKSRILVMTWPLTENCLRQRTKRFIEMVELGV